MTSIDLSRYSSRRRFRRSTAGLVLAVTLVEALSQVGHGRLVRWSAASFMVSLCFQAWAGLLGSFVAPAVTATVVFGLADCLALIALTPSLDRLAAWLDDRIQALSNV